MSVLNCRFGLLSYITIKYSNSTSKNKFWNWFNKSFEGSGLASFSTNSYLAIQNIHLLNNYAYS